MGCVLIEAQHLAAAAPAMSSARRSAASGCTSTTSLDAVDERSCARVRRDADRRVVVVCHRGHGVTEFRARNACLTDDRRAAAGVDVPHLVIESRQDDREDRAHIRSRPTARATAGVRAPTGSEEPLLWIADGDRLGGRRRGELATADRAGPRRRHRTSPVTRRTRFPYHPAGNRVHFQGRLPEAVSSMRPGCAIRKPIFRP